MLCKCDDEERGFRSIQRGVGWCEAQADGFLLTFKQSFRNPQGTVGKNGQPPLWVRVASLGCNLSGTAEACAFVSNETRVLFCFFKEYN